MEGKRPEKRPVDLLPGESTIPLLRGPLTVAEQATAAQKLTKEVETAAERDYKDRQIELSESGNRATRANIILTVFAVICTAIGAWAAWYQGAKAKQSVTASQEAATAATKSAQIARDTLKETIRNNTQQAKLADSAREAAEKQSREALRSSAEAFHEEQRPYLWMSPSGDVRSVYKLPKTLGPIEIIVPYRNYGRSPANLVAASGDVEIGANAFKKLQPLNWKTASSVVAPGKDDFYSIYSRDLAVMATSLQNTPAGQIATLLRLHYTSDDGHAFETYLCFYYAGLNEPDAYCPPELGWNRMIDCRRGGCSYK